MCVASAVFRRGIRIAGGYVSPHAAVTAAFLLVSVVAAAGEADTTLRVLSYNIHHGRGIDGLVDLPRIAAVIRGCQADIVFLQEVDDRTERTGRVDQTAELARLTGLHGEFGHQIDYQGCRYGQALLSRTPLTHPQVHVLPGDSSSETRIAFSASTERANRAIVIVGTHLHHLDSEVRLAQAQAIASLDLGAGPIMLGGDFNAGPDSPPLAALLETWESAIPEPLPTYPAATPTRQIDSIRFRPAGVLEPRAAHVLDEPVASDNRPILEVFRLH